MASRGLGSLTLDLIAKIGGFVGPLSQADRELDKRSRAMQRRANDMQKAITGSFRTVAAGITGFVAGFVSVQAVFTGIKSAIDAADKLNDFNQRLGISAEALSGWGYAAKQTGTDLDALGVGLKKLSKNMADALDPKSQQAGLFEALGVDVKDAQGNLRSLESILPEIADKFKELDNETLEAALSMQLFGKSGTDLLELLNQGSKGLATFRDRARELGIELSQDTLSAADAFNDKVTDLQTAVQGLFTEVAVALLPELTKLVDKMVALASDGERTKQFVENLATVVSGTAHIFEFAAESVGVMINQLAALKTLGEGVINLDWAKIQQGLAMGLQGQARQGANAARLFGAGGSAVGKGVPAGLVMEMDISKGAPLTPKEQSALERRLNGFLGGGSSGSTKRAGKSDAEKEADRLNDAYKNLNASLTEQAALFGKTGEAAKVRYDIEFGSLQGLTKAQKDELIVRAEKIDTLREEAELEERLDALHDKRAEATKSLLDDLAFESELLGKTADEQELLNNLRWLGVEASEADRQKVIAATQAMQERREVINEQTEAMDALRDAGRGFFDDLREGEGIWDSLTNAADRFADTITRMIENKLIEQLFGQQGSAGGGAAGGWISTLFGSLFGGGRAGGGGVSPGMFYRVNENGPEMLSVGGNDYLMMGNQPGIITPRVRTGGSGVTQTLHFHYAAPYDARTEEQKNARLAFETSRAASRNR